MRCGPREAKSGKKLVSCLFATVPRPSTMKMSKRSGASAYEAQRRQRIAWCQANTGVEDDISKYWGKAKSAYSALRDWWGSGDYVINSNSLIAGGSKMSGQPMVVSNRHNGGEVRIRYREYLGDVRSHPTTVGAWNNVAYTLNAGNMQTFPWLASIAANYEQWTPHGIIFEFRSLATDYSTAVNLGSVVMATDYDYSDTAYTNKAEALNSAYSQEGKSSQDVMYHGIECARDANPITTYYCTTGTTVPAGTSVNEYFLGKFQIATVGGAAPANTVLGSLYINYEISLKKPQLGVYLGRTQLYDAFALNGTVAGATPLGNTAPTRQANTTLGGTVLLNAYYFPSWVQAGLYKVTWTGTRGAIGAVTPYVTPTLSFVDAEEITPPTIFCNGPFGAGSFFGNLTTSRTTFAMWTLVRVRGSQGRITFSTDGTFSFDAASLVIEQVNPNQGGVGP